MATLATKLLPIRILILAFWALHINALQTYRVVNLRGKPIILLSIQCSIFIMGFCVKLSRDPAYYGFVIQEKSGEYLPYSVKQRSFVSLQLPKEEGRIRGG